MSWDMMQLWQPFLAMRAFLEADLKMQESTVNLVHRDKFKDMMQSRYEVQSVLLNPSPRVAAQVLLYVQGGFF